MTIRSSLSGLFVLILSLQASAECFTFINSQGPTKVGSIALAGRATQMCFSHIQRLGGGSSNEVRFSDQEGELAIFGAQIERSRGLETEIFASLNYGNANGMNVDATGVQIHVNGQRDTHIKRNLGRVDITDLSGLTESYLYIAE